MIVDASVSLKWLIEEELTAPARLLIGRSDLMAPDIIDLEVANALTRKVRERTLSPDDARRLRTAHARMPVLRLDWRPLQVEAFDLSLLLRTGLADCLYLAAAISADDAVVTSDKRFANAVRSNPQHSRRIRVLGEPNN